MTTLPETTETCAVCAKPIASDRGVAHLYHQGRAFTLCCPMCIEMFQRAPERFARGDQRQTLMEQLVEEMKWRNG